MSCSSTTTNNTTNTTVAGSLPVSPGTVPSLRPRKSIFLEIDVDHPSPISPSLESGAIPDGSVITPLDLSFSQNPSSLRRQRSFASAPTSPVNRPAPSRLRPSFSVRLPDAKSRAASANYLVRGSRTWAGGSGGGGSSTNASTPCVLEVPRERPAFEANAGEQVQVPGPSVRVPSAQVIPASTWSPRRESYDRANPEVVYSNSSNSNSSNNSSRSSTTASSTSSSTSSTPSDGSLSQNSLVSAVRPATSASKRTVSSPSSSLPAAPTAPASRPSTSAGPRSGGTAASKAWRKIRPILKTAISAPPYTMRSFGASSSPGGSRR